MITHKSDSSAIIFLKYKQERRERNNENTNLIWSGRTITIHTLLVSVNSQRQGIEEEEDLSRIDRSIDDSHKQQ